MEVYKLQWMSDHQWSSMVQYRLFHRTGKWHMQRKTYSFLYIHKWNKYHNNLLKFCFSSSIHLLYNTGEYRRVIETTCGRGSSDIETLESAKIACSSDKDCVAIRDDSCDSKKFILCKERYVIRHSCHGSFVCGCGYIKEDLHGK